MVNLRQFSFEIVVLVLDLVFRKKQSVQKTYNKRLNMGYDSTMSIVQYECDMMFVNESIVSDQSSVETCTGFAIIRLRFVCFVCLNQNSG